MLETPDSLIGTFAVLQALSGFIPVPLLDGFVERRIARSLVETVSGTHGIRLPDEEIKLLASAPDEGLWAFVKGAAKGILLFPLRLLFKAIFLVLDAKEITEIVGRAYARGVALDVAFGEGLYVAHGATAVANAVESALAGVDTRPLSRGSQAAWATLKARGPALFEKIVGAFRARREDEAKDAAAPLGDAFATGVGDDREALRESLRKALRSHFEKPQA